MNLLELDDAVTEIVVFGKQAKQAAAIEREVSRYLKAEGLALKAIPWDRYNELIAYIAKARVIYDLIYVFITVLASFIVFNTLMMVVTERTKEIGMLTALGLTPRETRGLFLWEGAIIACLGSLIGVVVGGICNWLLSGFGLDISKLTGMLGKSFLMAPKIYTSFRFADLFFALILGVTVTLLAAYLPARRAAQLKPTLALRTI
jgi:putative ABC transport system permease protein